MPLDPTTPATSSRSAASSTASATALPVQPVTPATQTRITRASLTTRSRQREKGAGVRVSLKSVGAITIFAEHPQRSKAFYENVFDAQAVYEDDNSVAFKFDNTIVNLLARREA